MTIVSKYEDEPIMNELAKLTCCLKRAVIFQESLPLKKINGEKRLVQNRESSDAHELCNVSLLQG